MSEPSGRQSWTSGPTFLLVDCCSEVERTMPLAKKRKGRVCVPSEKLRYLFGVDVKILVHATPSTNSSFFGLVFFVLERRQKER